MFITKNRLAKLQRLNASYRTLLRACKREREREVEDCAAICVSDRVSGCSIRIADLPGTLRLTCYTALAIILAVVVQAADETKIETP